MATPTRYPLAYPTAQPRTPQTMPLPVVRMTRGAVGMTLVARSVDELLHRLLAEEDYGAADAGATAGRPLLAAAGPDAEGLFKAGDVAAAGLGGGKGGQQGLALYLIRKAGMYPDVCEQLALGHLARGDKVRGWERVGGGCGRGRGRGHCRCSATWCHSGASTGGGRVYGSTLQGEVVCMGVLPPHLMNERHRPTRHAWTRRPVCRPITPCRHASLPDQSCLQPPPVCNPALAPHPVPPRHPPWLLLSGTCATGTLWAGRGRTSSPPTCSCSWAAARRAGTWRGEPRGGERGCTVC